MTSPDKQSSNPQETGHSASSINSSDAAFIRLFETLTPQERTRVFGHLHSISDNMHKRSVSSLTDKITAEHIASLISNADERDKRDRTEIRDQQRYKLIHTFTVLLFVAGLIGALQQNQPLLLNLIFGLMGFLSGFGVRSNMLQRSHQ